MYSKKKLISLIVCTLIFLSCKKFVQIDPPKNSLVPATIFNNDHLASSAVLGLYQQMSLLGYASGDSRSISTTCGLTADEFIGYSAELKQTYDNLLSADISAVSMWPAIYANIYNANSTLEGLEASSEISTSLKEQLRGEALFVRAFNYFYLANLYGPIPLHTTTNYLANSKASRASLNAVYTQIIQDLKLSESLLDETYVTVERVRPNKSSVRALLARIYLYTGDWVNAERYASLIIEMNSIYRLSDLDQIFLKNSSETIWQLVPPSGSNTPAGSLLILTTAPLNVSLRRDFVEQAFEQKDLRKAAWVRSLAVNNTTYYYPFKYKVRSSTTVTEYTMVFRLTEQFLIRAEARAHQGNLATSIDDVDAIRKRAGLPLIKSTNPSITKPELLMVIEKERRVELFTEWGHRWFDLKRTGRSNAVFSVTKTNWKPEYVLFPIPNTEVQRNSNIKQNDGY